MSAADREDLLIEATLGAHRHHDADGLPVPPPEWWDLSPDARELAARLRMRSRAIERVLHPRGWSSTVVAVMARIEGLA
jgi:hypothetical protein